MKILLMKKDGIIHKVSALDAQKVQEKLDAGFEVVGEENLEPASDITEAVTAAVASAIEALDIDTRIATAVADVVKIAKTPDAQK
jgi:hypothetical protein